MEFNLSLRGLLQAGLACALLIAMQASAEPDVLERPALTNARAANAVMLAVARADKRLVAVGERGLILLSDDNGVTWRQGKVPVSVSLTGVHFPVARTGWAVGHSGVVLSSTDGGETWVKQLDGRQAAQLVLDAVRAAGADDGTANQLRRAEAERLVADGPDKPFFDVHFFDQHNGLIVGAYGLIFGTHDGGKSWQSWLHRLDNPKGKHLYGIRAEGNGIAIAGEQGALFVSADKGKSFRAVESPYAGTYFGVFTMASNELLVFGLRGNAYLSRDGGLNWRKSNTGAQNTLTAGHRLVDGSLVLVDEGGRVLTSRDGGSSFRPMPLPKPSPLTGVAQAADGALVLSGVRGLRRIPRDAAGKDVGQ